MTSSFVGRQARKAYGAFYSPAALVDPMVSWAISRRSVSVMDPSCGSGAFLVSAARRLLQLGAGTTEVAQLLQGMDLNPEALEETKKALTSLLGEQELHLKRSDFFDVDPPTTLFGSRAAVDAVVGNPPYIRYQGFAGPSRARAIQRARWEGVGLTQLTSSWAPFVIHACAFLKRGGRLALILPAELVHSDYAAPVRSYLRKSFSELAVISFRDAVFPGVQEEVVLVLGDGKGEGEGGSLRLAQVTDSSELSQLEAALDRADRFARHMEPRKWLAGFRDDPGLSCLDKLQDLGHCKPLRDTGKANIGFVSGANRFFALKPSEAAARALPDRNLKPCVIRARQIPGASLTQGDSQRMQARDERCLLWIPGPILNKAEKGYVRYGESIGIHERYKCRVREPWFRVPGCLIPDAFLTYMSDAIPRLCLNRARAMAANTLLTVRLPHVPESRHRAFVAAFYNSATLLWCEHYGRSYGGGVLKLEPREADRMLVPSLEIVMAVSRELSSIFSALDGALRQGTLDGVWNVVKQIDALVLRDSMGLTTGEVQEMAHAREKLRARRRSRATARRRMPQSSS